MSEMTNQYRFLAAVVLECTTPLLIGSGNKTIKTDSQINLDCNGLPFIPGTTLTGILRHAFENRFSNQYDSDEMFGSLAKNTGSRLIVSEAKILDQDGEVIDGMQDKDSWKSERKRFFENFNALPIRQHAKIGHQGTTVDRGKFDEEIVFKGTRFCFEIELVSDNADDEAFFKRALGIVFSDTFFVGSKTNSGYGKVKAEKIKYAKLDFENDFDSYLNKSAKIDYQWGGYVDFEPDAIDPKFTEYELDLTPKDFIFFSSGFGNERVDNTSVKEKYIVWTKDGKAVFVKSEESILIPAASVKGAIAHRTAFHYNRLKKNYATEDADFDKITGKNNKAVNILFGSEGEKQGAETIHKRKGIVVFSDVLQQKRISTTSDKVFNHVAIDRFTGGTIEGALFDEECLYAKGESITMKIFVDENKINEDKNDIMKAFELALADIKNGMLPLGGGVTKGNGFFSGKLTKNGTEIYGEN